jgi:hypothetical protein
MQQKLPWRSSSAAAKCGVWESAPPGEGSSCPPWRHLGWLGAIVQMLSLGDKSGPWWASLGQDRTDLHDYSRMSDMQCAVASPRGEESSRGVVSSPLGGGCGARRGPMRWTTLVGCDMACASGSLHRCGRVTTSSSSRRCVLDT